MAVISGVKGVGIKESAADDVISVTDVCMTPIKDLRPFAGNPRDNDHAVDAVAKNIKAFGFLVPILINGVGEVVDGHLRLKAAQVLGMSEVPTLRVGHLTRAQVRALRISINKLATLAEWNTPKLKHEFVELKAFDFSALDLGEFRESIYTPKDLTAGMTRFAAPSSEPTEAEAPQDRAGDATDKPVVVTLVLSVGSEEWEAWKLLQSRYENDSPEMLLKRLIKAEAAT